MTDNPDRRRLMQASLAALPALMLLGATGSAFAEDATKPAAGGTGPEHDFDFLLGAWNVEHRRLKKRLAGNNEWEEFGGFTRWQPILGGIANFNDSVVNRPTGTYRGLGMRAFDAKTGHWADWYLDGRDPTKIDVHGVGRFAGGVGTFLSDDTFEGKPIKVRGRFSSISSDVAQWEQAFSPDGGKTWETNYVMRYLRTE